MARLLLVEDDTTVAELVTFTLGGEGHAVRVARDASAALREFESSRPELVILDVALPDRSGIDVCAAIRLVSRVPILFLTARSTIDDKVRGFRVGADDYLAKPFLPTELALRVDALLRRGSWGVEPGAPLRLGDLEVDLEGRVARRGGEELPLSPMELDLLAAMASTPGRPWSAETLARRLGIPVDSSAAAAELIRVKISRLRRKLGAGPHGRPYVRTRRGTGYVAIGPEG